MRFKPGDRKPAATVTLTDLGEPLGVLEDAASVRFVARDALDVVVDDDDPEVDTGAGTVTHSWLAGETDLPGRLWIRVQVVWDDGLEQTFPPYGDLVWDIED